MKRYIAVSMMALMSLLATTGCVVHTHPRHDRVVVREHCGAGEMFEGGRCQRHHHHRH